MRLYLIIAAGLIAVFGGGYYFANSLTQNKASDLLSKFEKNIESKIPGGDLIYDQTSVQFLSQTVVVEGLAFELEGERIGAASKLKIAVNDNGIDFLKFTDFSLNLSREDKAIDMVIDSVRLVDVDMDTLKSFFDMAQKRSPKSLDSLKQLNIGELDIQKLKLKISKDSTVSISANADMNIKGMSNGVADQVTFSGNINNEAIQSSASVSAFEVLGFDFGSFAGDVVSGKDDMFSGLKTAYQIRGMHIKDFKFDIPEKGTSVSLANGNVRISNNFIEHLNFEDFEMTSEEDVNMKIGKGLFEGGSALNSASSVVTEFEGLDFTSGFSSHEMFLINLLTINTINLTNLSLSVKGKTIKTKEIGKRSDFIENTADTSHVEVKTFIRDLEIPFEIMALKGSQKDIIQNITKLDRLVLNHEGTSEIIESLGADSSVQAITKFAFSAKDFGVLKLSYDLAIDKDQLELLQSELSPDSLKRGYDKDTLFKVYNAIGIKAIKIEYEDQNLADVSFQKIKNTDKIIGVIHKIVSNTFVQYPEEKAALLAAVKGFIEGKNTFTMGFMADKPMPFADILNLFKFGQLNRLARLEFQGS